MFVDTARAAADLIAPHLAARPAGSLAVLYLDAGLRLIETGTADPGEGVAFAVPVRDILAASLRNGAASLILGHRQAEGEIEPGEAVRAASRRLADAAAAVDIRLVDHLVFAGNEVRSFREMGLI